jgi:hypothetical protein
MTDTPNPRLLYDATVVLEFQPDGEQVLKVAISDAVDPILINKHGEDVIDGPVWERYVRRASKWMEIDYTIASYREDDPKHRLRKALVDLIDCRFQDQQLDPTNLSIIEAYAKEIIDIVHDAYEIEKD